MRLNEKGKRMAMTGIEDCICYIVDYSPRKSTIHYITD